jgi:hypothetical protein
MVVCWASHMGPSCRLCPSVPVVVVLVILRLLLVLLLLLRLFYPPLLLTMSMMRSRDVGLVLALLLLFVLLLAVLPDGTPLPFLPKPPWLQLGFSVLVLVEGICCALELVLVFHSDPGTSDCLLGVCSSSKSLGRTLWDLVCRSGLELQRLGSVCGRDGYVSRCCPLQVSLS